MIDIGRLSDHLIRDGIIRPDQFEEAKQCVSGRKLTMDRALLVLKLVDYSQLGKCYSDIYKLPYLSLLQSRPPEEVRAFISAECAGSWKVFPWGYDPHGNVLTVAVHEPEQMSALERISSFFMQPYTLAFSVASQAEIEEALATYYGVGVPSAIGGSGARAAEPGERKKIQLLDHSKGPAKPAGQPKPNAPVPARPVSVAGEGDANGRVGAVTGSEDKLAAAGDAALQEFSYTAMRGILRSAAALAVRAYLGKNPTRLQDVCARVRYCELLSSRLSMSMVQSDAVILAAWLSGMEEEKYIIKQLVTPYKLDELLSCGMRSEGPDRLEARILSLVKCFQELCKSDPNASKDVGLLRRLLRRDWSSSPVRHTMLETFLQVLMDEQFIDKLDHVEGRILIVDPAEGPTSIMAAPLTKYGYEVETVVTAEAAEEILHRFKPDLILCERDLPGETGIEFCEKVKGTPGTVGIRVIILSKKSGKEYAAESLRAGAADFLQKPVNLEVLFLKIRQLMTPVTEDEDNSGMRGLLSEMNFVDMIQIITAGGKSKEITLSSGDKKGCVFLEHGEVIHASVGDVVGEQAFYDLMHWHDGEFTMKRCDKFPERTINQPAMSLLMQGAQSLDEKSAQQADQVAAQSAEGTTNPSVESSQPPQPSGA